MTITLCVGRPAMQAGDVVCSRNGPATASTTSTMIAVRTANSSHCSIRMRREFFRIAASKILHRRPGRPRDTCACSTGESSDRQRSRRQPAEHGKLAETESEDVPASKFALGSSRALLCASQSLLLNPSNSPCRVIRDAKYADSATSSDWSVRSCT